MHRISLASPVRALLTFFDLAVWTRRDAALGPGVWISTLVLLALSAPSGNPQETQIKPEQSLITTDAPAAGTGAQALKSFFDGRWDLTIRDAKGKEMPSWLEIVEAPEKCEATFVGRWGSARPLPRIEITGNHVVFVS